MNKSLYINSDLDKQPGDTSSRWKTYLSQPFDFTQYSNVKIGLKNIQVPNTAYNFSSYNDQIYYALSSGGLYQTYSIQNKTDRHYENVVDWLADLNEDCIHNLNFTFNESTKKISVTNTTGTNLKMHSSYEYEPTLANNGNERLGIGFRDASDFNTHAENNETITFSKMPKLIRTNCYYLCCDIIDKTGEIPYPFLNPLILNKFSTANFGQLINERYDTIKYVGCTDRTIDELSFYVIDDELQEVDFNGSHITLELEFLIQ